MSEAEYYMSRFDSDEGSEFDRMLEYNDCDIDEWEYISRSERAFMWRQWNTRQEEKDDD